VQFSEDVNEMAGDVASRALESSHEDSKLKALQTLSSIARPAMSAGGWPGERSRHTGEDEEPVKILSSSMASKRWPGWMNSCYLALIEAI
jgi:hypothetical protein